MEQAIAETDNQLSALYPPTVDSPAVALPIYRYLPKFVRNPLAALPRSVYERPLVTYGQRRSFVVWVTDPHLIERVLLGEAEKFPKTPLDKRIFKPLLGDGILTSEGESWRWQRKVAAPMFRHAEILSYVPEFSAAAERQLERWSKLNLKALRPIDDDMTRLTFDVITRTVLAGCGTEDGNIIKREGTVFLSPITWEIAAAMLRLPEWVWHPGKAKMRNSATRVRSAVARVVAQRRAEPHGSQDILSRLINARHPETGEPMPDDRILDNLSTFLAAGHETTAKALTWTLYLLARSPEWQERLYREVVEVAGNRPLQAGDLEKLTLTAQVLKESMRLYPPAPVLTRITATHVQLGDYAIEPRTLVVIPIYAVHRHRMLWRDPDRFDPERFTPEREATIPRTQFMPFGFGQRTCIGMSFAMIEALALLAALVRGAEFDWDGRHLPEPISRVTLRPLGGMPLFVTPRQKSPRA